MPRVKRSVHAKKKRRKILKHAKGYVGARSRLYRVATEAVERAWCYAYAHRRRRKRDMRRLWIARINAGARLNGLTYSRLIDGLTKAGVRINRKVLAQMAVNDPEGFAQITSIAKASLS